MQIKNTCHFALISIVFAAATLTGCAHSPPFSGQSVTDPVLRKDVLANVQGLFSAMTNCRSISNVDTTIASIEQSPTGSISKAVETWQVSGCGTRKTYKVELKSDARGETDFSVSSKG